jgi:hypothetical protein
MYCDKRFNTNLQPKEPDRHSFHIHTVPTTHNHHIKPTAYVNSRQVTSCDEIVCFNVLIMLTRGGHCHPLHQNHLLFISFLSKTRRLRGVSSGIHGSSYDSRLQYVKSMYKSAKTNGLTVISVPIVK